MEERGRRALLEVWGNFGSLESFLWVLALKPAFHPRDPVRLWLGDDSPLKVDSNFSF